MADPRRSLGDPVALLLPRTHSRWPLWAMMALGLHLSMAPITQRWNGETAVSFGLLSGLTAFGLALFARLHEPLSHLAALNAFIGLGYLAQQLLGGQPGPLWPGPLMVGLALAGPAWATLPAPDAPPAWQHNPSSWLQRLPAVTLGAVGAIAARGSRPACAALLVCAGTALIGGRRRWRASPWAVFLHAACAAAALAVTGIELALAPSGILAVAALAAGLTLLLGFDEADAARFFLRHAPQLGQPFAEAFWHGGRLPEDPFAPRPSRRPAWTPPRALGRRHGRRRKTGGFLGKLRGEP